MSILTLKQDPVKAKRIARLMKTIGHPARLQIIDLLLEKKRLSVKEIYEHVEISQSNASQHLKALEDIEVLASERNGKQIFYWVENEQVANLLRCVNDCATC